MFKISDTSQKHRIGYLYKWVPPLVQVPPGYHFSLVKGLFFILSLTIYTMFICNFKKRYTWEPTLEKHL